MVLEQHTFDYLFLNYRFELVAGNHTAERVAEFFLWVINGGEGYRSKLESAAYGAGVVDGRRYIGIVAKVEFFAKIFKISKPGKGQYIKMDIGKLANMVGHVPHLCPAIGAIGTEIEKNINASGRNLRRIKLAAIAQ